MATDKKPDRSLRVPQKAKLKTELQIRNFNWTDRQKEFIQLIQDKKNSIILCKGPAGSAKTILAVWAALNALNSKQIGEIVYVRSIVESSNHSLGFLPGTSEEKLSPYLQPLMDKLEELLPLNNVRFLIEEQHVRGLPIGFMRGSSINSAYILADESQNLNTKELLTVCTRIGKFSKLIITGDTKQSDVKDSGFEKVFDAFEQDEHAKEHGIVTFKFGLEDIMRSDVIKFIIEKFEDILSKK